MGGGADGRRPFSFALCSAASHGAVMDDPDFADPPEPGLREQLLAARRDIMRQLEVLEIPSGYGGDPRQRQNATDELNATLAEIEDALAGLRDEEI